MKKTCVSFTLGLALAAGLTVAASACPYSQTSAQNDAPPPQQTAATTQTPTVNN